MGLTLFVFELSNFFYIGNDPIIALNCLKNSVKIRKSIYIWVGEVRSKSEFSENRK